jgi:uncharacterized tellurite resistance protein B-like protein
LNTLLINLHQPSSTFINLHQPSSTLINLKINLYQPQKPTFPYLRRMISTAQNFNINNEAEACAAILFACRKADEITAETENAVFVTALKTRNIFMGRDYESLLSISEQAFKQAGSPEALIDASFAMVREQTRLPLLYHCLDVILANGVVTPKEHKVFQYLKGKFKIANEAAYKAIEVLTVKNLL